MCRPSPDALSPAHCRPSLACSGAQRAVYEAVLEVHRSCLEACRPGSTLRQLHHISVRLLADALAQASQLTLPACQCTCLSLLPISHNPHPCRGGVRASSVACASWPCLSTYYPAPACLPAAAAAGGAAGADCRRHHARLVPPLLPTLWCGLLPHSHLAVRPASRASLLAITAAVLGVQ